MIGLNARVDNVGTGSLARRFVVRIRRGARLVVGKTGQAPVGILLRHLDADDGILLNVVDLYSQRLSRIGMQDVHRGCS